MRSSIPLLTATLCAKGTRRADIRLNEIILKEVVTVSLKSLVLASSAALALTIALPPSSFAQPPEQTQPPTTTQPPATTTTQPPATTTAQPPATTTPQPPATTTKQPAARTNTAGTSGSRRSLPGTASPLPMMFLGAFALFGAAGFVRM